MMKNNKGGTKQKAVKIYLRKRLLVFKELKRDDNCKNS
jgi:hypothetical protein